MSHKLTGVCLITDDVGRLASFYRSVLQLDGEGDDQYFYFQTDTVQLSIFSAQSMKSMAPGSMRNSGTGRCTLEFQVEDVDAEYDRLTTLGVVFVKPPTTHPWGLRAVWFRDPDGNVIDFYAPVAD
mgnify:CR=1 FL=1